MLAQCAERGELDAAVRFWAPVHPLAADWAFQVSIEAVERIECGVANEALVRLPVPIPRALRGGDWNSKLT